MNALQKVLEVIPVCHIHDFVMSLYEDNEIMPEKDDEDAMEEFWEDLGERICDSHGFSNYHLVDYSAKDFCIVLNYLRQEDWMYDCDYDVDNCIDTCVRNIVLYAIQDEIEEPDEEVEEIEEEEEEEEEEEDEDEEPQYVPIPFIQNSNFVMDNNVNSMTYKKVFMLDNTTMLPICKEDGTPISVGIIVYAKNLKERIIFMSAYKEEYTKKIIYLN